MSASRLREIEFNDHDRALVLSLLDLSSQSDPPDKSPSPPESSEAFGFPLWSAHPSQARATAAGELQVIAPVEDR